MKKEIKKKKNSAYGSTYSKQWHGWLFIAPVMIGIILFTLIPMVESLYYSFFSKYNGIKFESVFSFDNYVKMFTKDADFWPSLGLTMLFTVTSVPMNMILSFLLAVLLNSKIRGMGVYRILIYLPIIIPISVSGIIWRYMADYPNGLINHYLATFGIQKFTFFKAADTALASMYIMGLWGLGGGMILWLSALKNVPIDLYEAADIDGANGLTKMIKITIPMCTPMILYNLIVNVIGALQTFGSAYTVLGGGGGPDNSLLFYLLKVYNEFTNSFNAKTMGYVCAECWFLFLIIAGLTCLMFKTSKWVFYGDEN